MQSIGPMQPHLSFVTLAVRDVARARRFYEALGLIPHERSGAEVVFFQFNGLVLALYGEDALATMWGGDHPGLRSRAALSHNVQQVEQLDAILRAVQDAGGRVSVPRGPTPWGGERAWFEDLDGHRWEVVYNPKLQRDAHGGAWLSPRSTP